jgi:hypothetical protein
LPYEPLRTAAPTGPARDREHLSRCLAPLNSSEIVNQGLGYCLFLDRDPTERSFHFQLRRNIVGIGRSRNCVFQRSVSLKFFERLASNPTDPGPRIAPLPTFPKVPSPVRAPLLFVGPENAAGFSQDMRASAVRGSRGAFIGYRRWGDRTRSSAIAK